MSFDWKDTFTMDPVYDAGTYEAPSWTVGDDFFKYDPKETGGIDWSTIYANQDVLKGLGDSYEDPFSKGIDFLKNFPSDDEKSQYFDAQKAASGLPTNKSRESWYQQISPSVGVYGGSPSGGFLGGPLPAIAAGQGAFAGMNPGMQSLGFNDYAKMAAQGLGSALKSRALYAINPVLGAVDQFYPGGATEAFKDVTRFAGGIGNTISKGIKSVVDPVQDFLGGIFG